MNTVQNPEQSNFFQRNLLSNIFSTRLYLKKCVGRKGKGLGAPHSLPPCLLLPSKQQQDQKPQIKRTFFKEFHCQNIFFLQAMPQKVCGEKGKRPRCSTFPNTMSEFTIKGAAGSSEEQSENPR